MLVRHGQYQHLVCLDGVEHAVWKTPQGATANVWCEWVPGLKTS